MRTELAEPHCYRCHSDFGVKATMTDAQKDEQVLRYILTQDGGWVFPGDSSAGRLHARVWGTGAEKVMPPDEGAELLKQTAYRQLLTTFDQLVDSMIPGTRRRVLAGRGGIVGFSNRAGKRCRAIPNKSVVVVIEGAPGRNSAASIVQQISTSRRTARTAMATTSLRQACTTCSVALALALPARAEEALFQSRQLTPAGEYTFGIEGPAVDAAGALYVVNFQRPGTIGRIPPGAAQSELFAQLPAGSIGVSIRFSRDGRMFLADYKKHTVFVFARGSAEPRVYFQSDRFNQPNDMAITRDSTIYASDPSFRRREGQVWRITPNGDGTGTGAVLTAPRKLTATNGIELSPDEKTLYVAESSTNEIWAYRIEGDALRDPRLVKKFPDFEIDGIRADRDGRLYVARILKGTVAVLAPDGALLREIPLQATEPTNLAFGGPDGRTVFVTQRKGGFIEIVPRRSRGPRVLSSTGQRLRRALN